MIYIAKYESPIGRLLLAERDGWLNGVWIERQKFFFDPAGTETAERETPVLTQARKWLDRYFAGEMPGSRELPLAPADSDFRGIVRELLCMISYGSTTTYGELARKAAAVLGRKTMSAQAVGGAVGHNPFSVIVPCHRVVGTDGSLTGYAGGLPAKVWLLNHEGGDLSCLYMPKTGAAR